MSMTGEGSSEVGGRGGGGKFQKRRPQTTAYDRPPNAVRNPRNGWLSKVVDPASRLSNRLFNYVFGKRLPKPVLPPPSELEVNEEPGDKLQETVITLIIKNSSEAQEQDITVGSNRTNSTDEPEVNEEPGDKLQETTVITLIIKNSAEAQEQDITIGSNPISNSFGRYEIDRLHSRTGDLPFEEEEKRCEAMFSEPPDTFDRLRKNSNNPVQENETESHRLLEAVSTPVRVLEVEDDVTFPAQLAKAYMASRPSMLGFRSQALREDSDLPSNILFPPSIVPKSPAPVGISEKGTMKGVTSTLDVYGGPSSSQSALEQNRISGSKQGQLKRRNSVLDSDIGSVGPIRRIRHKPNLLSSKGLCTAIGGSPLPATGTDMPLSLIEKPHMLGESNPKFSKMLMESGDNSRPGVSSAHVLPSQSSEMAEKILPQLAACMPYSRVDPTATMKGVTSTLDVYGGPSSSQSALEQNRISGSKQGLLKRKSSVLDSDIGSVGPIRGIRHKPNLLSSKSSRTAIGGSPLSEKSLFSSILNKSNDAETSGTQVAPVSSMTVQPVGLASSTFDTVVVPLKELNAAPPPPPHVKKAPPFTFSKFGAFSEPKPESSSSSFTSVSACATKAAPKVPESSPQADTNNIQKKKAENSSKKPKTLFPSAVSASTSTATSTAGMFSFGAPSNNGLLVTSIKTLLSMFTSPSQLLGSNTSNQNVSNTMNRQLGSQDQLRRRKRSFPSSPGKWKPKLDTIPEGIEGIE